ncbi:succinylglutamate desuccinylase/aspartoacylase family protein [Maricaulaceae bacterium EIL42A08]|nr:succinylglutamate desuccinylase/aspartoacylase family protein [Maricaulaceae bacterium EIL42A08]
MRALLASLLIPAGLLACGPVSSACTDGGVHLITGYSGSAASPCVQTAPGHFELDIAPEAEPINPSPWYLFQVSGPAGQAANVTLNYTVSRHRYRPWVREAGGHWSPLGDDRIETSQDETVVHLSLELGQSPIEIAAQPVYGLTRYEALESRWPGGWQTAGQSVEGRPIRALVLSPDPPTPATSGRSWILLLGGQHPPEVPGAWAFEAFADAMVERQRSGDLSAGLILVPLLNPDGVEAGHWRLNAGLVDLNRDWTTATQPEIQAVVRLLDRLDIQPGDIELAVDFHATVADRLYLPQADELAPDSQERLDAWLIAMEAQGLFQHTEPRRTNPARRVSAKAVFTDEWQAIALTWEAGDHTPEATVRSTARQGAMLWE